VDLLIRNAQTRLRSLINTSLLMLLVIICLANNTALAQSSSDPETPQGWKLDDRFRSVGALRYISPDNSFQVELSAKPATKLSAGEWLDNYAVEFASGSELVSATPAKVDEGIIAAAKAYRGNDKVVDAVWLEVVTKTSNGNQKSTVLAAVVRPDEAVQLAVVDIRQTTERMNEYLRIAEVLAGQSAMQPVDLKALLKTPTETSSESPTTDKADASKEVGSVLGADLDALARKIRQEVDAELALETKEKDKTGADSAQKNKTRNNKAKTARNARNSAGSRTSTASNSRPSNGSATPRSGLLVAGRVINDTLHSIDLETGRYQKLSNINEFASSGVLSKRAGVYVRADRSVESGMLLTVDFCFKEKPDLTCFYFLDRNGNHTGQFGMNGRDSGPGKVSFDGKYVAVNRTDREAGLSVITIFTREGKPVSSYAQNGPMKRNGPYDWLPDGRLVYAIEGNTLLGDRQQMGYIISQANSAKPDRRIVLPRFYQDGRIFSIDTSPDGRQLLMVVAPRVGPRRPILIDVETHKITQLIDRSSSNLRVVRLPL